MKIYKDESMCTSCSACVNICPNACITMVEDQKGFLVPQVDDSRCINCDLCRKHCHTYLKSNVSSEFDVYSFVNTDENALMNSSSGGAFSAIASKILSKGGYVCGAVFDDDWSVKHIVSNKFQDILQMQGSKYVQSRLGNCFSLIKEYLIDGKIVLFTGTPCQVLGLRQFLDKDYDNLYLADVVCHSVPSPLIYKEYLELLLKEYGKISKFEFRNKKQGWQDYSVHVKGEKKESYSHHKQNVYINAFLDGIYHRESCNNCPVKTRISYASDITLADFWGYEEIYPQKDIKNGVSAVIFHTTKGRTLLENTAINKEDKDAFISKNPSYLKSSETSDKSDAFWNWYRAKGLSYAYKKLYKIPLIIRFKTNVKKFLKIFH